MLPAARKITQPERIHEKYQGLLAAARAIRRLPREWFICATRYLLWMAILRSGIRCGSIVELDGMDVRTCSSAEEMLRHPEVSAACCAVIDGKTLDQGGPDVIARLEMRRHTLPVILVADHFSRRILSRTIAASLFHVVEKPVLGDALLRSIRAVRRRSLD